MALTGLNHITFAVSDLDVSFDFYFKILTMKPVAKWNTGAYLKLDSLWLCLASDEVKPAQDYSHTAFTITASEFSAFRDMLIDKGIQQWKPNSSEGDSVYILDPDGHKLEIHSGCLRSRLDSLRIQPYDGLHTF